MANTWTKPHRRYQAHTIAPRRSPSDRHNAQQDRDTIAEYDRPKTRGDCQGGQRPCPFVSCSMNLYLDVTESGGLKINFPSRDPWELEETCALDVADRGGETLDSVGKLIGLTRERIRQVEGRGIALLYRALDRLERDD